MKKELMDRIRDDMRYEFSRPGPPEGFPAFPDIPTGRHTSDLFYELEQTHVWPNVWVLAGRENEIPHPGDYLLFDKLGVPLLVIRGRDGVVRCFYNTCRHRGAPVVREAQGNADRLRCQYHSWTYDIDDGRLIAVPDQRDFVGLDRAERCLVPAACEVLAGFIFVNRNANATPLLEWLGGAADFFAPYEGANLEIIYQRSEIVPCNWKVTAEAFMEVYHFKHIHMRDWGSLLENRGAAMGLYRNGHGRMITPYSQEEAERVGMKGWDDWQDIVDPDFPDISAVPDMYRSTSTSLGIFPNIIIPFSSSGFPINLYWPINSGTTRFEWIFYGIKDWDGDELPERWQHRKAMFDEIQEEDMRNMAPMHASLKSGALPGIPINYQERRIRHMHEQIDAMIGAENIPPDLRVEPILGPYVED